MRLENKSPPSPIDVKRLAIWLEGYDDSKKQFLLEGFLSGFHVGFDGELNNAVPKNLTSALQKPELVREYIKKELEAGRLAGPFNSPPFEQFQCSPIGLVEKKEPGKFRMIHHLSYPEGMSINDQIDPNWSSVQYAKIGDAIDLVMNLCPSAFMSKTDVKHAFRIIPLHPDVRKLFVFEWEGLFYVDLALQMGCSSSCHIFEAFSTAIEWIAREKLKIENVHILDDFFLASVSRQVGTLQLKSFLEMCADIGLPMAPEKTFWPETTMSFVGYEIDTLKGEVRLPEDKIQKCKTEILKIMQKQKATLKELQSINGLLNFACAVVLPGRPFLRRLIDLTIGLKAPHHHRRITQEVKEDMGVWMEFLDSFNGKSIFIEKKIWSSEELHLFTDAAGKIGYGGILGDDWFNGTWSEWWIAQNITLKEMYAILVAFEIWGGALANKRIVIRTDNNDLVSVLSKQTGKEPFVMILVRRLVLICLKFNIVISASHIPGRANAIADALSRLQMDKFRRLAPQAKLVPTPIPPLPLHL